MVKSASNAPAWIIAIVVLIVGIGFTANYFGFSPFKQTSLQGNTNTGNTNVPFQTGIGQAPILNLAVVDSAVPTTSVGSTKLYSQNNNPFVSTAPTWNTGDTASVLNTNGTTYHSAYIQIYKVASAYGQTLTTYLTKNASVAMTITGSIGTAKAQSILTNGGGAINQTNTSAGGSYNFPISMVGSDRASTQDMICIIDVASANTNKASLSLSGNSVTYSGITAFGTAQTGIAMPSTVGTAPIMATISSKGNRYYPAFYTPLSTSSSVWTYDVTPITGASTATGTLQVLSNSGQSLGNTKVKFSCYTKEWFRDTNDQSGTPVKYDIADALGNKKSIAQYTYTIQIQ